MKIKTRHVLAAIFLLILGIRLYFVFQTPNFSSEDAYFTLRQVEHIGETGLPLFYDELSYGGRLYIFAPVFHYILAFFSLILPLEIACKIMPNIFAASLVIVVYYLSFEFTKDKNASLFASFISGFIPIFFSSILNNISPYSLTLPLTFCLVLFFMRIRSMKYVYIFLVLLSILTLIHSSILIFVFSLLIYLMLLRLERVKQNRAEMEIILFSLFLVIWIQFILFKKAFLFHGPFVVWQNIPSLILKSHFSDISILKAIYQIGSVPLSYGIYVLYKQVFSPRQNRKVYLLVAFASGVTSLLWLKLIELDIGMIYLGIIMVVLFSQFYKSFFLYVKKTRFIFLKPYFITSIVVLFFITSILPSLGYAQAEMNSAVRSNEINALDWLRENSEENSTILSTVSEGHLITAIAERRNAADSNFLFINNIDQIYDDVQDMYVTPYETDAIELLNKYEINYIYFSDNARKEFGITELSFIGNGKCFELVYNNTVLIYHSLCRID